MSHSFFIDNMSEKFKKKEKLKHFLKNKLKTGNAKISALPVFKNF